MESVPDFFVVGAPRAATTSLYHALDRHPQIFAPAIKEPHRFAFPEVADTYYDTTVVDEPSAYAALYRERRPDQVAGDFSTSYLFRHRAAGRIASLRAEAKIVMVLRDPVERALSHHRMDRRDGYTTAPMAELIGPTAADPRFRREYVDVGRYADQIRAYREHFDDRQLHIILFEDLIGDEATTLRHLLDFLGVDPDQGPASLEVRNHTGRPRALAERLRPPGLVGGLGRRLNRRLGPRSRRLVRRLVYRPGRAGPTVDERRLLADIFEPEIRDLERVIGRDLSSWGTVADEPGPRAKAG